MSRPEGDWNHQPSDTCRMLEPFELSRPDICCPMFLDTGSGDIESFRSTVNIWAVNCARATAFIFDTRTDVLAKVFWDRKCLDLRGIRTPNLRIHAELSNHSTHQGQIFAVPCFLTLAPADIFLNKVYILTLTVCGQQHSFCTHGRMFLWKWQSFWDRWPNIIHTVLHICVVSCDQRLFHLV